MIPYLYETTETSFTTQGIGRLSDAISCFVTEERNGPYELEMKYPITGALFSEITNSRIISAVPADGKARQPFRIYRISKPLDGICTIYAEHISYELNHIPVMPFTAGSCAAALTSLVTYSAQTNPFTVWTNKGVSGTFTNSKPRPFRELLGGAQGSILDVYGTGEYEFDKYTVKLYTRRGYDTGVTIRYAKNLTDLKQDENIANTITGVCPYWWDDASGTLVTLPEKAVWASTAANFPYKRTAVIDFSSEWEEAPTVAQLRARANKYITDNNIGVPKVSIDVEFVNLADMSGVSIGSPTRTLVIHGATVNGDTLEGVDATVNGDTVTFHNATWKTTYADYKVLERINLCDTVTVVYDALGVSATAKVVKTVYDVLLDRYKSIEVGEPKTTLASQVVAAQDAAAAAAEQAISVSSKYANKVTDTLTEYVDNQTSLITGGQGGFIVYGFNANGQPEELYIMDTADPATATNVIRMNKNGIGFSTNGLSGPYTSAWTIDGVFNASFIGAGAIDASLITVGTMLFDHISGGTLRLGGSGNGNGLLEIYDKNDNLIGTLDNNGADLTGLITLHNDLIYAAVGEMYTFAHSMSTGFNWNKYNSFNIWTVDNSGNIVGVKSFLKALVTGWQETSITSGNSYGRSVAVGLDQAAMQGGGGSYPTVEHGFVELYTGSSDYSGYGVPADTYVLESYTVGSRPSWRFNLGPTKIHLRGTSGSVVVSIYITSDQIEIKGGSNSLVISSTVHKINGSTIQFASTSARRYKHDIKPIADPALDPHKLLDLPVSQFVYNEGAPLQYDDTALKTIPGIIAEDVAEHYPAAVIHNADGEIESWDERRILPGMLALIQEQQTRLDEQERRIARLEKLIEEMTNHGE